MTSDQFSQYFDEMSRKNYFVLDIEVDEVDGTERVSAVWQKNIDNRGWAEYRNLTDHEFSDYFDRYSNDGFMMVDFDPCPLGNELRYAAVWVENNESLNWIELRDMTSEEFAAKFDEYRDEYWLKDIESYEWGGTQYYGAIWVENISGRGWYEYRDMTAKGFGDKWL